MRIETFKINVKGKRPGLHCLNSNNEHFSNRQVNRDTAASVWSLLGGNSVVNRGQDASLKNTICVPQPRITPCMSMWL